ncbi:chabaupain 2 [Plasmodium vinckei brucechwatti]|uniref:Chabaupain 2 n=1 Tax=Plasmodium vinckei brucechwatti TaxID=119398 RepID=A0A6V7S5D2_PLAVN|nr:chabaupain 2 [Plasmodium vinckei brucechwatti]
MNYHSSHIRPEEEMFVDKGIQNARLRKKNQMLIVTLAIVLSMFGFTVIYFNKTNKSSFNNLNVQNDSNDDYLINYLLKSKAVKKFMGSKIEELIIENEKNAKNANIVVKSINDEHNNYNEKTPLFKKNNDGKKFSANLYDMQFIMSNLESVNIFYNFMKKFNKQYSSAEEMQERFYIFSEKLKKVEKHNKENKYMYKKGINSFSDMRPEEFKMRYLNSKLKESANIDLRHLVPYTAAIGKYKSPTDKVNYKSFDWRDQNVIIDVKDQKRCASCWAFATAGVVAAQYAIRKNKKVSLSEQQLVDCAPNNDGCEGGILPFAFEDLIDMGGLCEDAYYPYVADVPELCEVNKCTEKYSVIEYALVPYNNYKEAIQYLGPITIAVGANEDFQDYDGGIYDGECEGFANHAVILVGYGVESVYDALLKKNVDQYYYIIRNSWSSAWGEDGYMRLKTDESGALRNCVLVQAYAPIIE